MVVWAGIVASAALVALPVGGAQPVQHLPRPQRGGFSGEPVISSIQVSNRQMTVTWHGFLGGDPLAPFKLMGRTSLKSGNWQVLASSYSNRATIPIGTSNMILRVTGGAPEFAGASVCAVCHLEQHTNWMATRHAGALATLQRIGQGNNAACLPCHTVGYGSPGGYTNVTMTSLLGGVQCENCHGPAGLHAANPRDASVRPVKEVAATLCGGCHGEAHHPNYQDWQSSAHALVTEDMTPTNRINSCGRCHSGTARLALIGGEDPAQTVASDANMGIVCVVCHDPHRKTANPAQLRYPVASTNDYYLSTSDVFSNKYNPNINVCAQCHNHRGASWSGTSRPPHHSPQYNILLGTVGETASGATGSRPAAHALWITNQCAGCHMQKSPYQAGPPEIPAVTGHKFKVVSYEMCANCHPFPELLAEFVKEGVSNQVQQVKYWLDYWALNKAPAALRTKYGVRAWEYTVPGTLSNPPGVTNAGPSTAEQAQIPERIKKARYNLYLVYHDGSFGVHNGPWVSELLEAARNWVQQELAP